MADSELVAKIEKIKDWKPSVPGGFNCIDMSLGDSGYGVRMILTFAAGQWTMSTSIGVITADDYTPMPLDNWTVPLRESATKCAGEVMDCFDIDPETKTADMGTSIVMFTFRERS